MKKPEELAFMKLVMENEGKIPSSLWDHLTKRQYSYLDKWSDKGWWEYGVSSRSGWLEKEGWVAFTAALSARQTT